jgi:hypothetical protein
MAVLGVCFKHLCTSVNGVGKRHINSRDLPSAIFPIVVHLRIGFVFRTQLGLVVRFTNNVAVTADFL